MMGMRKKSDGHQNEFRCPSEARQFVSRSAARGSAEVAEDEQLLLGVCKDFAV